MAPSLKLNINTLLNKLRDRDTFSLAAAELGSISRNLDATSLPIFLSCILSVDSSDKIGVRKQCVKLISVLAVSYPNSLPHFLPKILTSLLRRLRDPDSSVRSECINAVSALSTNLTKCNFSSSFLKPLSDALFTEQEPNAQIGAALCLEAAIEGSPDVDPARLERILAKLEKFMRSNSCKAKAAVLVVIGSVIGSGGASNLGEERMKGLVGSLVKFLSSDDWAARKGAAEALGRLAMVERDSLAEFKTECMKIFEARRFDKVKAAREVMSQMLAAWKQVPDVSKESSPPPRSLATSKEDVSDGRYPPGSKVSSNMDVVVPQRRMKPALTTRSTSPDNSFATTARKRTPLKATVQKANSKKPLGWRVDIAVPQVGSVTGVFSDCRKEKSVNVSQRKNNEKELSANSEIKQKLFNNKNSDDTLEKVGGSKFRSRVTPYHEQTLEPTVEVGNAFENLHTNHKESEDLSSIRNQLVQIEKQQSSLLDLLQRFIYSSQNGMQSLETRVHGLEVALDEISYDLAVSTGRMSNSHRSSCCLLPAAGFLSSKLWRKTDGGCTTSRVAMSGSTPSVAVKHGGADRNHNAEAFKRENHRLQLEGGCGFIRNPLAEMHRDSRCFSEIVQQ